MPEADLLGRSAALLAALVWGVAVVLFKRAGDTVPPLALNLFKGTVGVVMTTITVAVLAVVPGSGGGDWGEPGDVFTLVLSGILGIAVADTLFFYALNLLGVGLVSIVSCLYSPFVVGLSWMLLAERLTPLDGVGGALVLLGVYVSSRHPTSEGRTRRQLLAGSLLATASMATMAVSVVVAKPVLETTGIWQASLVRLAAGWLAMALLTPVLPGGLGTWRVFRPARTWRFSLPAAVLGTYVAMMLWLVGFKYTDASIAAILNQTSTIFGLVLAALFLREPLTGRKVAAIVLAFAGVVLITSF